MRPARSFYARLSALFLLLTLALGAGFTAIAFLSAGRLFDDVEQILNRDYARSIAAELAPLVAAGVGRERLMEAIHYMMVLNPRVEIYLLDGEGRVLSWFAGPGGALARDRVDLAPLRTFIGSAGRALLPGPDPRNAARSKPFSAAPLRMGGEEGYVYVILGGQSYDRSLQGVRDSYYVRAGLAALLGAVTATLIAGLALFFLLTRRLASLTRAVEAFRAGDLGMRVEARGSDELGALGRSFNEMAQAIQAGVEKLRLAERMRRELIANISHDLRSPIASIRGSLETILLKEDTLPPAQRRGFVEASLRNTESLQGLVGELFELVKLETRQVEPKREAFQLADLAQDVALAHAARAEAASVSLSVEAAPDLPLAWGDVGLIERVLANLMENALSFTPAGGAVVVALCAGDGNLAVSVADTGSGIPPEDLPHVFERFYCADKSRDRSTGGAGLGLAIARQIVELHEGRLEAESEPGRGATFRFTLPLAS